MNQPPPIYYTYVVVGRRAQIYLHVYVFVLVSFYFIAALTHSFCAICLTLTPPLPAVLLQRQHPLTVI